MENELKTQQKTEALERMRMLNILGKVRNDFRLSGRVYYSERQNKFFDGILYWLDNEPRYIGIKKAFEKQTGALVYHAQVTHLVDGDMLSLLYVSPNQSEWNLDREDIKNGQAVAHCIMLEGSTDEVCEEDEYFAESGYIGIKSVNGGITRLW